MINKSLTVKINDFDFIGEINQNYKLKQLDINSYAVLVYRIIQLYQEWNSIKHLKFTYTTNNLDYSSCIKFLNSLNLSEIL